MKLFANSVDADQTAPLEQSHLCLHCLLKYVCLNNLDNMESKIFITQAYGAQHQKSIWTIKEHINP